MLLREVVVREAVKSAWRSVDQGHASTEMTNWKSTTAMGLDVIGEDEEEEEYEDGEGGVAEGEREERWFEDLITSFGEEDFAQVDQGAEHEWTESNVASAFDDDMYEEDAMEAYTFPMSPPSPRSTITFTPEVASVALPVGVEVVEVDNGDEEEAVEVQGIERVPAVVRPFYLHVADEYDNLPVPVSTPIQPTRHLPDLIDDDIDEYALPPPLVRSFSSSSDSSMCDSDVCVTPPNGTCEELEEEAGHPSPTDMSMSMSMSLDMSMESVKEMQKVERGYDMTRRAFGEGWLGLRISG